MSDAPDGLINQHVVTAQPVKKAKKAADKPADEAPAAAKSDKG